MTCCENPVQPHRTAVPLRGTGILVARSFVATFLVTSSVMASSLVAAFLILTGCGTPGAPQPPSLNLPVAVTDLTAVRNASTVALHWTMPKKTVDHLLIKAPVPVAVCWREGTGPCQADGVATAEPGATHDFLAPLPPALTTGSPRPVFFFVELKSPKGRSAGLSNPTLLLAGQAPGPILGLTAEARADGAALHWTGNPPSNLHDNLPGDASGSPTAVVRLHRKLLSSPIPKAVVHKASGPLKSSPEPPLRDLLVIPHPINPQTSLGSSTEGALDKTARFGEEYQYTAQRVLETTVDGKGMEIAGELSAPIEIQMIDTFPPTVPKGLVAVFVPEEKTIDLSWEPDADPDIDQDLAGYMVYRAESSDVQAGSKVAWKRISPEPPLDEPLNKQDEPLDKESDKQSNLPPEHTAAQLILGTSFRDTSVVLGHSYRYVVTAIDQGGRESQHSKEATATTESAPNP